MKFTGHERDYDWHRYFDLDYMHARYFWPRYLKFMSIDPAASWVAAEPQSWNRYAYGLNNPIKYLDPDGRESIEANFTQFDLVPLIEAPAVTKSVFAYTWASASRGPLELTVKEGIVFEVRPEGVVDYGLFIEGTAGVAKIGDLAVQGIPVSFGVKDDSSVFAEVWPLGIEITPGPSMPGVVTSTEVLAGVAGKSSDGTKSIETSGIVGVRFTVRGVVTSRATMNKFRRLVNDLYRYLVAGGGHSPSPK